MPALVRSFKHHTKTSKKVSTYYPVNPQIDAHSIGKEAAPMAKVKVSSSPSSSSPMRPALTPEARESQCISLAYDLAEQQLRDGTASSQETTHFLKLGTEKARLEKEILERQKDLITAKTEALRSEERIEKLMTEAINAMRGYQGLGEPDEPEDY